MAETGKPRQELTVWYDGDCAVCRASRDWVHRRSRRQPIRFVDFRTAADGDLPVTRDQLESAMWVQRTDGKTASAFTGWRMILHQLRGWRWLALVTAIPPVSWLGALGYRLVARWRFRIATLLGEPVCETDQCSLGQR